MQNVFIKRERCIGVKNGENWAMYMSISRSPDDEYNTITLQYTQEGLFTIDKNREGHDVMLQILVMK